MSNQYPDIYKGRLGCDVTEGHCACGAYHATTVLAMEERRLDRAELIKAIIAAVEGSVIERTHAKNEVLRDVLAAIKETAERIGVRVSE